MKFGAGFYCVKNFLKLIFSEFITLKLGRKAVCCKLKIFGFIFKILR